MIVFHRNPSVKLLISCFLLAELLACESRFVENSQDGAGVLILASLPPWIGIAQYGGYLPEKIRTTYHSLLFILIPVHENPNSGTYELSCWKVHSNETM